MRNWEFGDEPWIEHARWYPHCAFVKHIKGQSFINICANVNEPVYDTEPRPVTTVRLNVVFKLMLVKLKCT